MRKFGVIFGGLCVALAGSLGIYLVPAVKQKAETLKSQDDPRDTVDFENARELLAESKPEEALSIIITHKKQIESLSENGVKWLGLFIEASEQTKDAGQLAALFEFFPEIFKRYEQSSLLAADFYINHNQVKEYRKIRSLWNERETKVAVWFLLDVDALLLEGKRNEAITLLKSRRFKDKADVGRLTRLALMYTTDDPKTSWKYLGEALAKNPQNPDIHSYRGKLLESSGKNNMAHKEYQSAIRLDPNNLFLKDQLADFYLRQRSFPSAVELLGQNLTPPSLDRIWVKTLFFSKVAKPITFDWKNTPMPQGNLDPFIDYLITLKSDQFWDETAFSHLTAAEVFLKTRQETFWLKLLQHLKSGNDKEALHLLKFNPFKTTSWYPELEMALKRILNYRLNQSFIVEEPKLPVIASQEPFAKKFPLPEFFAQLEESSDMTQELKDLLLSKEVFSAAFIAAGWTEAGLKLHAITVIPGQFPDWVAINLTQALSQNHTLLEALEFADLQKPTPELLQLSAELLIKGGDREAALAKLNKLSKFDSDIGYKSAWIASLLYIEMKEYGNARTVIYSQPRLVKEVLGQETLARIALLEGDKTLADKLYTPLESKSSEARSYLARKAYAEKNWTKAKELTELLLKEYPENATLQQNLKQIQTELKKGHSS